MTQMLRDIVAAMIVAAAILVTLALILAAGIGVATVLSWMW